MKKQIYFICIFFFFCSIALKAQAIRYVIPCLSYDSKTEIEKFENDFHSWEYASCDLQLVIDISNPGDEIWVAQGEYIPFYSAELSYNLEDDYYATIDRIRYIEDVFYYGDDEDDLSKNAFVLKDGVKIYGGIDPNNDERCGFSVLKGLREQPFYFQSYHVVIAPECHNGTILDGFVIINGNADSDDTMLVNGMEILNNSGGGIYNKNSQGVQYSNLHVLWNEAKMNGGGIYDSDGSSSFISDCYIQANTAGFGGGVYCLYNYQDNIPAKTKITSSLISGNKAIYKGGALYNSASHPVLVHVTISGNYAKLNEDLYCGIYNGNDPCTNLSADITILNSILYRNGVGDYLPSGSGNASIYNELGTGYVADFSFIDVEAGVSKTGGWYINAVGVPIYGTTPEFKKSVDYSEAPTIDGDYRLVDPDIFMGLWEYYRLYCNSHIYSRHPEYPDYQYCLDYWSSDNPIDECVMGAYICPLQY